MTGDFKKLIGMAIAAAATSGGALAVVAHFTRLIVAAVEIESIAVTLSWRSLLLVSFDFILILMPAALALVAAAFAFSYHGKKAK